MPSVEVYSDMDFLRLPFYSEVAESNSILIAGAGGGFDIFTGLPLYFGLRQAGKKVHLANLSFSTIYASTGRHVGPSVVEVTAKTEGMLRYFPELHLTRWFASRGEDVPNTALTGQALGRLGMRTDLLRSIFIQTPSYSSTAVQTA